MTALAAWLIGLPSPLALGTIAGLMEFIPYVGPILGALPAIFAAPIAVMIFVAVKKLYIRDSLSELTPIPGETP